MIIWLSVLSFLVLCGILLALQSKRDRIHAMRQEVDSLRADLRDQLRQIDESVNRQLHMVAQQLQSQTTNVGSRLDSATRVFGDIQKNLGELGQAAKEMKELGQSVGKLEELLRAPKLRGGLGEYLLEDLLRQVLPSAHVEMQHRFRSGQTVDAVIRTGGRLVPVDSKFPLEKFRRLLASEGEAQRNALRKGFLADVRKHIDDIADKYILPEEGTFPFALMYVPAENVYYEIIIREEEGDGNSLYNYAIARKVIPVSPNSFYAYLQVIALGLRGLSVERSAQEILAALTQLDGDMERVRDLFAVLGSHIENARKKYDETDRRLGDFEHRLHGVVQHRLPGTVAGHSDAVASAESLALRS